jgi:DNA-directed RNA polymerase sigma subunit (sigma70/sigma32)
VELSKNWYNYCPKKTIFNLKKIKNQIAPETEGDLRQEHVAHIADKLAVSKEEVVSMIEDYLEKNSL